MIQKTWLFCVIMLDIFAVVPLAGTWIEISAYRGYTRSARSSPSRGRGLKFCGDYQLIKSILSSPSRGRGLKYYSYPVDTFHRTSSPSRGRGLKFYYQEKL